MEKENLKQISIEELISYSKQKEVPAVTIIDDITKEEFDYIYTIAERLSLFLISIKNSEKIAVINNSQVAKKMAKDLKCKSQIMYYDFVKRPSGSITIYALTGYTKGWDILRDNGYIVKSYDECGNEIEQWINTEINYVEPVILNKFNLSIYRVTIGIKGINDNKNEILKHSRQNFINDGIYNEKRNCYYPKNTDNNKNIAEFNKLEKLFKKWGFSHL